MEIALETVENDENQFSQRCYMAVELMQKIGVCVRSCIQLSIGTERVLCVVYPMHGMSEDVILYSKSVTKFESLKLTLNDDSSVRRSDELKSTLDKKGLNFDTTDAAINSNSTKDVIKDEINNASSSVGDMGNISMELIRKEHLTPSLVTSECLGSNSLHVLKCGNVKGVTVRVVFRDYTKMKYFRNNSVHLHRLCEQCKNCITGLIIGESYTVDLRRLRLARLYGISYIHIEKVHPVKKHSAYKSFLVSKTTEITVNKLHSVEWFEHMTERSNTHNLGGLREITSELLDLVCMPINYKKSFNQLGVKPPRGILLRGPPGCGKTSLVKHVAILSGAYLKVINGPEILGSLPGETETNLEKAFETGVLMCEEGPCILFIDELDSLCPRSSKSSKLQQSRVTGKLLSLLDGLTEDQTLVVIGATNRPSVLDPAIRRPGRMDREVSINPPTLKQRREILKVYLNDLPVANDLDLDTLADVTNGYVGADLASLCQEVACNTMATHTKEITMENFMTAIKKIRPSLQRGAEGLVDLRPVYWSDIGGLEKVKAEIRQAVQWPLKHPEAFCRMGLVPSKGVLLYGPPGCAKTTLVRAAATSCHATFLSISGAQLYSPYVGDSEALISETFQRARLSSPSIIFLDEIDSIVGKRSESGRSGVQDRILSTLLNEMDGVGVKLNDSYGSTGGQKMLEGQGDGKKSVTVSLESLSNNSVLLVAATNRPDLLDEALMRPGRIDKIVYVPHPDIQARRAILKVYSKNMGTSDEDINVVSEKTDMYTGADLENLCREAALCALTENMESCSIHLEHFTKALNSVKPSLNKELIKQYSRLKANIQE